MHMQHEISLCRQRQRFDRGKKLASKKDLSQLAAVSKQLASKSFHAKAFASV